MKNIKKKVSMALLATSFITTFSNFTYSEVLANTKEPQVLANWKFDEENIKSGSIENKDLVIEDATGNGNDLRLNVYGNPQELSTYFSYSDDKMYEGTKGSIKISGDSKGGIGADLITVDDAPINKEKFEDGYTIEFLYKLPLDWTAADSWMGLMARQGESSTMDEPELGTMSMAVSNCKEIQFLTANKDDSHKMNSAAWSVSMDKGGVWYHIAVVSDNESIRTYVNGCEAFRDYSSSDMQGLYADPNDGRFRIGSSYWVEGDQTLDKFARGNFQEVRVTEGALDRKDWLISEPEKYIGDYGVNDNFELRNNSNYNMVFLPDTQNTIKFKGQVMDKAMSWLVENKDRANLTSVVHLGDIVENGWDLEQWNTTKTFYALPQNGINLLMQPGNHDSLNEYKQFFGKDSEYGVLVENYIVTDSPSGVSSYMITDGGSYKYLTLAVSIHNIDEDLPWVKEVLSKTNMPTVITSHDLQNCSDTIPNDIKLSKRGNKVWDVVKNFDQVFMMIGGHSHGAGDQVIYNTNGKPVFNILADYQFAYNGGNALFKFAEFDERNNKIYLSTFSPYAEGLTDEERTFFDVNYLTGAGNYTEFDINFEERFAGLDKSEDAESYKEVNALIDEINLIKEDVTMEDKAMVQALLNRVNSLPEEFRTLISNLDRLTTADEKIKELERVEAENQENKNKAQIVIDKIDLIPDTVKLENKNSVIDARNAYNNLTKEQQALVTNLSKLIIAEDKIKELELEDSNTNKPTDTPDNNNSNNNTSTDENKDNNAEELPYTGGESSAMTLLLGTITVIGGVIFIRKKKIA